MIGDKLETIFLNRHLRISLLNIHFSLERKIELFINIGTLLIRLDNFSISNKSSL